MGKIMIIKGLRKVYRMGKEKVIALDHVDLDIEEEKVYCLLGPSGSGKSTLLNMMAGLEPPTKGSISFKNLKIDKMNESDLANFRRRHIGFIFQSYNLIPTLNALENITMPLLFKGVHPKVRHKVGMEMLDAIGIKDRWRHKPTEMSGGQQQRVSLARAFINDPDIIFADEPTGNLDTKTANTMMMLMLGLVKERRQTLIIVTHNEELAVFADYVIHIRDGNIYEIVMNADKKKVDHSTTEI
ncbi:MAG: macrolide ABC transporter ATP-binding protein [Firmicutes bacterium HGW-Firmicutes-2]|jgi:putative ABC transport system ATP-binding protein|nr:MAG: macrolide ABC transporter ATP-binding protein [Firmicutes bacterium HGW-Firmicutes-2]